MEQFLSKLNRTHTHGRRSRRVIQLISYDDKIDENITWVPNIIIYLRFLRELDISRTIYR